MTDPENGSDLTDRVALVTGASRLRGIGAAICRSLAARGADVAFSHWRSYDAAFPWSGAPSEPDDLALELVMLGVRTAAIESDLGNVGAEVRLLDETEARLGPISILINNAAYSTTDGFERLDAATIDAHYAVNMRAAMLLAAEFARRFAAGDGGRIINITSGQGLGPMPDELAYGATKGAIEAFTRSLAPAVAAKGITVNAVNPGPTDSGWISPELRDVLLPRFPMGRLGTPADAARLVAWLASPDAGWVTGQVIHSEGGIQPRLAAHRAEAPRHGMISRLWRDDADFWHLPLGQRTTGRVDSLTGKIALVFPGQGSQFVGMGNTLYDASAAARRVFDQADEVLGFPLSRLCFQGPSHELEDTINAQPAILTVSIATLEALRERLAEAGKQVDPTVVAGHSLGEFTALIAAGVMDFPSGLQLVRERGRLMKEAGEENPGGMAAVIGLDADTLAAVCHDASNGGVITVANDNCPGQTVISGEVAALLRAMEMAKARGAKRVARLGISIASHSPLMARASASLSEIMSRLPLGAPQIPVVANVTATAMLTVEDVRQELAHHVERPVNWTRSVAEMVNSGATTFIEVGPGQVLSGLIRRINRDVTTLSLTELGLPADVRNS